MTDPVGEFWVYELERGQTLASHDWVEWHIHKLLSSRFVAYAVAEGRRADIGTAMLLWAEAFRQDPAGTLPDDDVELAQLARFGADLDGWRRCRPHVLYGWRTCQVRGYGAAADGHLGPRLGHDLIAEIAVRSVARRDHRRQGQKSRERANRRWRVRSQMERLGMKRQAGNATLVEAVLDWLDRQEMQISTDNVRAAAEAVGLPRVVDLRGNGEGVQG